MKTVQGSLFDLAAPPIASVPPADPLPVVPDETPAKAPRPNRTGRTSRVEDADLARCEQEGREAHAAGAKRIGGDCPYWLNSRAGKAWLRGWDAADKEHDAASGGFMAEAAAVITQDVPKPPAPTVRDLGLAATHVQTGKTDRAMKRARTDCPYGIEGFESREWRAGWDEKDRQIAAGDLFGTGDGAKTAAEIARELYGESQPEYIEPPTVIRIIDTAGVKLYYGTIGFEEFNWYGGRLIVQDGAYVADPDALAHGERFISRETAVAAALVAFRKFRHSSISDAERARGYDLYGQTTGDPLKQTYAPGHVRYNCAFCGEPQDVYGVPGSHPLGSADDALCPSCHTARYDQCEVCARWIDKLGDGTCVCDREAREASAPASTPAFRGMRPGEAKIRHTISDAPGVGRLVFGIVKECEDSWYGGLLVEKDGKYVADLHGGTCYNTRREAIAAAQAEYDRARMDTSKFGPRATPVADEPEPGEDDAE